jgi:hypothetical protein
MFYRTNDASLPRQSLADARKANSSILSRFANA